MDILAVPVLLLFKAIISLAIVVVVADVLVDWLLVANILNAKSRIVSSVVSSLYVVSEFMLRPIRKRMPTLSLDLSPVVLILLLTFFEWIIDRILMRFA